MAVLYVDDGGDDSDGLTWAKAFNSIENAAILAAAAGSTIYIGSDHQETKAAKYNIDFSNGTIAAPITIISSDNTSGEPPTTYESMVDGGGFIQTTGAGDDLDFSGNVISYGLKFDVQDITAMNGGGSNNTLQFHDCLFDSTDAMEVVVSNESSVTITNSTIDTPFDMIAISGNDGTAVLRDIAFTNATALLNATGSSQIVTVEDCDVSSVQPLVNSLIGNSAQFTFRRCLLHADTLTDPINGSTIDHLESWILIESSAPGTDTVPVAGLNYFEGFYGKIEHDEVEYRTGGASNGETPYSWKMTCNGNTISRHAPLKTPPITAWKAASSQTLTVYVAHDAVGDGAAGDLQDDECWLEISSPDETDATTARGNYQTTLPATVLTAAADLTNEGSDEWQATPTTYQQITATIDTSLAEAGPIVVRVCLATGASSIVWVDPKLYFS